jgi:hypothetical protein
VEEVEKYNQLIPATSDDSDATPAPFRLKPEATGGNGYTDRSWL